MFGRLVWGKHEEEDGAMNPAVATEAINYGNGRVLRRRGKCSDNGMKKGEMEGEGEGKYIEDWE